MNSHQASSTRVGIRLTTHSFLLRASAAVLPYIYGSLPSSDLESPKTTIVQRRLNPSAVLSFSSVRHFFFQHREHSWLALSPAVPSKAFRGSLRADSNLSVIRLLSSRELRAVESCQPPPISGSMTTACQPKVLQQWISFVLREASSGIRVSLVSDIICLRCH